MIQQRRSAFDAEIEALRDQLVEAVRGGRLGAMDHGLDSMRRIASTMIRRASELDRAMGQEQRYVSWMQSFRSSGGLGGISEAIWIVLRQAIICDEERAVRSALATVGSLQVDAWEFDDLSAFDQLMPVYVSAVTRLAPPALTEGNTVVTPGELVGSVVSVLNATVALNRDVTLLDKSMSFSESVLRTLTSMGRDFIDRRNAELVRSWAESYASALRNLDLPRHEPLRQRLYGSQQACYIALQGWLLYSLTHPHLKLFRDTFDELRAALRPASHPGCTWTALTQMQERAGADPFGWRWWESSSWPANKSGGMMEFDGAFWDSALIELIESGIDISGTANDTVGVENEASVARLLLQRLGGLRDRYPHVGLLEGAILTVEGGLKSKVWRQEAAERDRLRSLPISAGQVARFAEGAFSALEDPGLLTHVVASWEPDVEPSPHGLLGMNFFVSKDYFVEGGLVGDSPLGLGETFGSSVARGETRMVLKAIEAQCPSERYEPDLLVPLTLAAIERHENPMVCVVGDFRAWDSLTGEFLKGPERYTAMSGDSFAHGGVEFRFVQQSDDDVVLVGAVSTAVRFGRGPISPSAGPVRGEHQEVLVDVVPRDNEQPAAHPTCHVRLFTRPLVEVLDTEGLVLLRRHTVE